MAKKQVKKIEVYHFQDLHRGTSVTIPVAIKKKDGTSFDLSEYKVHFTLKPMQSDYDYDDIRAYISKDIEVEPEQAAKGRFDINLSSKETWLTPGMYYFDIMLVKGHSVARLCLCQTEIVGGPTNNTVDHEVGPAIFMTDLLALQPDGTEGFVIQTDLVSDPPENMVETLECDPPYLIEAVGEGEDPRRHLKLRVHGPRLSFPVQATIARDSNPHPVFFGNFFKAELPDICPVNDMVMTINNRKIKFTLPKTMEMLYTDMYVQHSPEVTFNADSKKTDTNHEIVVGDNVTAGQLHIQMYDGNDYIDINGNYSMNDDLGGYSVWFFTVNWYNWVDIGSYEPEEQPDLPDGAKVDGPGYNSLDQSIWPPDIMYGEGWEKK